MAQLTGSLLAVGCGSLPTPHKVVEIVIQNNRAGEFGGEYASNNSLTNPRNGREQHPFHLHG